MWDSSLINDLLHAALAFWEVHEDVIVVVWSWNEICIFYFLASVCFVGFRCIFMSYYPPGRQAAKCVWSSRLCQCLGLFLTRHGRPVNLATAVKNFFLINTVWGLYFLYYSRRLAGGTQWPTPFWEGIRGCGGTGWLIPVQCDWTEEYTYGPCRTILFRITHGFFSGNWKPSTSSWPTPYC